MSNIKIQVKHVTKIWKDDECDNSEHQIYIKTVTYKKLFYISESHNAYKINTWILLCEHFFVLLWYCLSE